MVEAPADPGRVPIEVEFRGVNFSAAANGGAARPILRDIELGIRKGETLVLLGRSGSGKTTALKLINRLLEPSAGQVLVEGVSTTDWNPIELRRRTGYVIQETGLLPHFTIERNVGLVPRLAGWPAARIRARVEEMLALVGLDSALYRTRYPRELSGGQRQRVGVARALAADPDLLLMDEPFGALDAITRVELQRQFHALKERLGKTVVFVTHDLREALLLATRIALVEEGRLAGVFSPAEFLAASDPGVAGFRTAFGLGPAAAGGLSRGGVA